MAEMSFGRPSRALIIRDEGKGGWLDTPANPVAFLQGCVAARPAITDEPPLVVDFPDRPAKMLAAVLPDYGPASRLKVQLVDLPRLPLGKLKASEVVVEIHAASINPTDWKQRKGTLSQLCPLTLPCILGIDFSGRVVRAGESAAFTEGDEVFGRQTLDRMRELNGSYAEYAIVDCADIYRKPSGVGWEEAAAVPHACLAAYAALGHVGQMVDKRKEQNKSVLILGGSGGVGTFAVQLAKKHFGCYVVASCSFGNAQLVRDLGADEVLDYTDPGFLTSTGLTKFDVIVDCVGGDDYWQAFKASLKQEGVYVTLVGNKRYLCDEVSLDYGNALQIKADYFFRQIKSRLGAQENYHILTGSQLRSEDLPILASLLEQGVLTVVLAKQFPLIDVAQAHLLSESHHVVGKIVIQIRKGEAGGGKGGKASAMPRSEDLDEQMERLLAKNRQNKDKSKEAPKPALHNRLPISSTAAEASGAPQSKTASKSGHKVTFPSYEDDDVDEEDEEEQDERDVLPRYGAPGSALATPTPGSNLVPTPAPQPFKSGDDLSIRLKQLQAEVEKSQTRIAAMARPSALADVLKEVREEPGPVPNGAGKAGKGTMQATKPPAKSLDDPRMAVPKMGRGGFGAGGEDEDEDTGMGMGMDPRMAIPKHGGKGRGGGIPDDPRMAVPKGMEDPRMAVPKGMDDPRMAVPKGMGAFAGGGRERHEEQEEEEEEREEVVKDSWMAGLKKGGMGGGMGAAIGLKMGGASKMGEKPGADDSDEEMGDPRIGAGRGGMRNGEGREMGMGGRESKGPVGMFSRGAGAGGGAGRGFGGHRWGNESPPSASDEEEEEEEEDYRNLKYSAQRNASPPQASGGVGNGRGGGAGHKHQHQGSDSFGAPKQPLSREAMDQLGVGSEGVGMDAGLEELIKMREAMKAAKLNGGPGSAGRLPNSSEERKLLSKLHGDSPAKAAPPAPSAKKFPPAPPPEQSPFDDARGPSHMGGDDEMEEWVREARAGKERGAGAASAGAGSKPYPVQTVQGHQAEAGMGAFKKAAEGGAGKAASKRPVYQPEPEEEEEEEEEQEEEEDGRSFGGGGPIQYEGLLRKKKEDHGMFEDPYKMVCVCRLQDNILRVRLTHNGEVVGLEEQYDLQDWRVMVRLDKGDRFSLMKGSAPAADNSNVISFKADVKAEAREWIEALQEAEQDYVEDAGARPAPAASRPAPGQPPKGVLKGGGGGGRAAAPPGGGDGKPAGVGIVFKEGTSSDGPCLMVKSLAPGGAAESSMMIEVGDVLLKVDKESVTTTAKAAQLILGPRGSPITLTLKRFDDDAGMYRPFTVAMMRGITATLGR